MNINRLQKFSYYFFKLLKERNWREYWEILTKVPKDHILHALRFRLDREPFVTTIKNVGKQEINFFLDLLKYKKNKRLGSIYEWQFNDKLLYATELQFIGLYQEYLAGVFKDHYHCDCKGKNVLDVGGFIGDTALYFLESHAKRVVIYEPLPINVQALRFNLAQYNEQVEIHEQAISNQEKNILLTSSEPFGSLGFGCVSGNYSLSCQSTTFQNVLSIHQIDVAKIDCEGAEQFLCQTDETLIRKIPYWIIETHDSKIYEDILQKFYQSRFEKCREFLISTNPQISLIHFQRIENE